MGYDFDTVTNKHNLLFCIYDTDLVRCHLFSFDKDKHTLDILDLPESTYVVCDGFSGTLADAYELDIFPNIISRFLSLKVHSYAYISADDFASACKLLEVSAKKETILSSDAYLSADEKQVKSYYSLLSRVLVKLDDMGSVEATAKLAGILVNGVTTDMSVSDMIALTAETKGIKPKDSKIHLLPGICGRIEDDKVYMPNGEKLAELLNTRFRAKGSTVPPEKLGIYQTQEAIIQFDSLPENITDY